MAKRVFDYQFEVYLMHDTVTSEQWQRLYDVICQFGGNLVPFEVLFTCIDNVTRFFIHSRHDLSGLSNNLDGILLRPVTPEEQLTIPRAARRIRFVQFVTGGNILDFKEKLAVKRGLDMQYTLLSIKPLLGGKALVHARSLFKNGAGQWVESRKVLHFFPVNLLGIDFASNTHYLKKGVPRYLDIEKSLHLLTSESPSPLFEIDTFPYLAKNYFLNLTGYEFDKHSFIIGATGSGKSKLISLYVDRLYKTALKNNYRIIVIDPHASLADDFEYLTDKKVINFSNESTDLFPDSATDIAAATELTTTLFKSLLAEQFTPRLERLLRFSLFVLFTAQNMSLDMLKRFLTEIELRNQILQHVANYVPANISRFFGADFNELRTNYYNEAIAPITTLVDEMQLQPALAQGSDVSLAATVQQNFLTIFSLNKVSMGEKTVKTIAGLLIQQIFLLAQARLLQQKVILIVDEVSIVQTPALASILAEARKFGLSVILTQQYFGQIEKELQAAIFSNIYNYYVFRVSEEDARQLEGNLNMELPHDMQESDHQKGLGEDDVRVRMLTELHPRECLLRLSANGKVNPCIKARTVDAPSLAVHHMASTPHLSTFTQATLPTKFYEAPTSPAGPPAMQAATVPYQPTEHAATSFNLSQLLAEHSSSRLNVNKRGA